MSTEKLKELDTLLEYGVPPTKLEQARAMLATFGHDPIVINIFHTFYSSLPDAVEDCIEELFLLERHHGQMLFCVKTTQSAYYYLANSNSAAYSGSETDGLNQEALTFFGFGSQEDFEKKFGDFSELEPYSPDFLPQKACPVCYCLEGEHHEFGCPVEVCPWCDGQLSNCDCRFQQLGVAEIQTERQLDTFLKLVQKKGRITFDAATQRPAYPTAGDEPSTKQ